jgi:hypothetical protein
MSKKRFWLRALLALIVVVLIAGVGAGAFGLGWWRGHQAGQGAVSAEHGRSLPFRSLPGRGSWMPHRSFGFPYGFPHGGFFHPGLRALAWIGGLGLLVILIGGLFCGFARRMAWRARSGGCPLHWHHHMHHPHDHPFEGKIKPDAEPEGGSGDAAE